MLVCLDASADTPDFVALSRDIVLKPPFHIKGNTSPWLYAGAFDAPPPDPERLTDISRPFEARGGLSFWKTQFAGVSPRPFIESELYGRWTYPLGVTLYGMLRAGERLGNSTYIDYVMSHVATPVDHDAYALYEKQAYGFPGLNEQLCWLDALDDCGSFGSLMLECDARCPNPRAEAIAERIADYMLNKQERMPDGAFQRHGSTIWADDMYMSVPFLVRYALRTNMPRALDEACAQLLLYRKYLFMPEKSILSHMRSLRHGRTDGLDGTPNGIPWCRGNGWVFFSLSELLPRIGGSASDAKDAPEQREAAPRAREAHPARAELIDFYNSLVGGYLALQGEHGLWHQILDDPESYEESSTTAMFICALVRGCVDGFISREYESAAISSARRAWRAIAERAVDRKVNLYGVCRGSGFSFSRAYYRALSWNFNDTHGIGIVMLAGVEIMRLAEWLRDGGARA
jgi:rhamnogalacturonyl hydrolase YesR